MGQVSCKRSLVSSLQCKGYYKSQCRSKTITEVRSEVQDEQSGDSAMGRVFLGAVNLEEENSWKIKMLLSGLETEFKLDTGAEVTAISEQTYQRLSSNPLTPPGKQLLVQHTTH